MSRQCVHTRAECHHKECKCSECPVAELICDEFYECVDRCHEDTKKWLIRRGKEMVNNTFEGMRKLADESIKAGKIHQPIADRMVALYDCRLMFLEVFERLDKE